MKKLCEEKNYISSFYYKKNQSETIMVNSDIHYHPNVDKSIFELLISFILKNKPDYVVMPGDQIETIDFIENIYERYFFEKIIRSIAEVSPLIIVPGNHEIASLNIFKDYSVNNKALRYFESLNRIKNVYFLNNEKTNINGMTFIGFNPRINTYFNNKRKNIEMFNEDYFKSGLSISENDYNVLVTHNPVLLYKSLIEDFSKVDLGITGHLHDGYLPKSMDKFFKNTNIGVFFNPLIFPIPGVICRGMHNFGRGYLFISQGFRKLSADIKIFNILEKIISNDIEKIIINQSDDMPLSLKVEKN